MHVCRSSVIHHSCNLHLFCRMTLSGLIQRQMESLTLLSEDRSRVSMVTTTALLTMTARFVLALIKHDSIAAWLDVPYIYELLLQDVA